MKLTNKDLWKALKLANAKLDFLLRHSQIDFAYEDGQVKAMTEEIRIAKGHIPPAPTNLQAGVQPATLSHERPI